MTMYRVGPAGIPSSLKTNMDAVLNKKFGTSTTYAPATWPDNVNLLGPLPERTASGVIASFSDGADDVPISTGLFSFTPKQAGTGTPSPSNPRAISGYTGATIYQTGKNLLDFNSNIRSTSSGGLDFEVKPDGGIRCYGTTNRTYAYITNTMDVWIPAGAALLFSRTDNPSFRLLLNCTFADGSGSGSVIISSDNYTKTWVVSKNVSQIRLELASLTNETAYDFTVYPMLEVGNTRTTWEPYKAKTPIVDTFGATVYGGSRATDGTLTETHSSITHYAGLTGWTATQTPGVFYTSNAAAYRTSGELFCDKFEAVSPRASTNLGLNCISYNTNYTSLLLNTGDATIEDFIQTMTDLGGFDLVRPLATPTSTTLPAVNISTYYGANNIYTDMETGDSSVTYRADINMLLNP